MPQPLTTAPLNRHKQWMSLNETADHLRVTTRSVRNYVARGQLTAYRVGTKLLRFDAAEVDAFLRRVPTGGDRGTAA